ncbi:GntR family transcriptional regulator [Roseomonas gilardii]|uniref:GntR family transcriptional regulator n=1 Tax=Roseomonas gilardii TaxID=257708 RepID=UPI0021B6819C|nr:GntR family transcriptional regulator [Roseomonas gilardii]
MQVEVAEKATSVGRVYEQLKLMAMTYRFRPGLRINEAELSKQLNVSRTPLREALNRLASEGYVAAVPNRGFIGRMLDVNEIVSLHEFRCALEQAIIRIVCERASDADLAELAQFAAESAGHDEPLTVAALQRDEEFHLRIARLTRNPEFIRTLENINGRIHFVRWIDLRRRGRSSGAHTKIVQLLQSRDAERCAEHLGNVIRRRREEIIDAIRSGAADILLSP